MQSTNKIELLKPEEARQAAALIKSVILENPYYNAAVKKEYISWYTPTQLLRHLKKKDMILAVAKISNKIVGFGSVWRSFGGVGWSDWTLVDKKYRREGIGTKIWNFKISQAKKLGIHKVVADSLAMNKEGNKFAKAHGLRRVAVLKRHWFGQDYYLWEKQIGKMSRRTKEFHWIKIDEPPGGA